MLLAIGLLLSGCVTDVGDGPDFTLFGAVGAGIGSVGRGLSATGDPVVEICGVVSDYQGDPVSGAKVWGNYTNGRTYWFTIKTDEKGEFSYKAKASVFHVISVSKEGYRTGLSDNWGPHYLSRDIKYDKERRTRSTYSKPLTFKLRRNETVEDGSKQNSFTLQN